MYIVASTGYLLWQNLFVFFLHCHIANAVFWVNEAACLPIYGGRESKLAERCVGGRRSLPRIEPIYLLLPGSPNCLRQQLAVALQLGSLIKPNGPAYYTNNAFTFPCPCRHAQRIVMYLQLSDCLGVLSSCNLAILANWARWLFYSFQWVKITSLSKNLC